MIDLQSPRPGESGAIDDLVTQALALQDAAARPAPAVDDGPAEPADVLAAVVPDAWTSRVAVFDLETTGVDTSTARIVTAFLGVLDEHGELVEQHAWPADPGRCSSAFSPGGACSPRRGRTPR